MLFPPICINIKWLVVNVEIVVIILVPECFPSLMTPHPHTTHCTLYLKKKWRMYVCLKKLIWNTWSQKNSNMIPNFCFLTASGFLALHLVIHNVWVPPLHLQEYTPKTMNGVLYFKVVKFDSGNSLMRSVWIKSRLCTYMYICLVAGSTRLL